jgi:hypothetical protein
MSRHFMIEVICSFCQREIFKHAALVFSPPDEKGQVTKHHLCGECYSLIGSRLIVFKTAG